MLDASQRPQSRLDNYTGQPSGAPKAVGRARRNHGL